jgi:hypothetical protein
MGSRQRQPVLRRPQITCSQGCRPVRDAEVAGSNPAHPTFAQFRGPVLVDTGPGYVAISAVLLVLIGASRRIDHRGAAMLAVQMLST